MKKIYFPLFPLLQCAKWITIKKIIKGFLSCKGIGPSSEFCVLSIPKNHVTHVSNFPFSFSIFSIIIIFNLTYALNIHFLFLVKEKHWKHTWHFHFKVCQQSSDNFIPLGCSQAYFSISAKCYPEIQRKRRYGVNNFYKHLYTQIYHKASSSKGNLTVICLITAFTATGTDCYPSVLVTKPTHIKAAITAPENFPCKIYAPDQLLMSLSIYSQFCSPFF